MLTLEIHFENVEKLEVDKENLQEAIGRISREENYRIACINIIVVSDEKILEINKDFLGHGYYTDIITFPLSPPGEPAEAELYISRDRIVENADEYQCSVAMEFKRVVIHGILHLVGYGDSDESQKKKMIKKEDYYLS